MFYCASGDSQFPLQDYHPAGGHVLGRHISQVADSFSSDVSEAILMIRRISQEYEGSCPNDVESDTMTHSTRMKAVDELLRSHTYAAEMRSAAKSASTWLRYIGRSEPK